MSLRATRDTVMDEPYQRQSRAIDAEERRKYLGWTITPSHYLKNQLDPVWLSE